MSILPISTERSIIPMILTQKETDLLKDLKSQEKLCIEKYTKYQADACDKALKDLFGGICTTEKAHLQTVEDILNGKEVPATSAPSAVSQAWNGTSSCCDQEGKQRDGFLCRDALAMEKHVSGLYDISIFEFANPSLRDTLAHIQKEEQNHGQQLYAYMSANGLYE